MPRLRVDHKHKGWASPPAYRLSISHARDLRRGTRRDLASYRTRAALAALAGVALVFSVTSPTAYAGPTCKASFGSDTPVLLVHGFNSGPGIWREGPTSMFKAIDGLAGTHVETFDYSSSSRNWVTDKTIGRALAERIACLSQVSSAAGGPGRVVIVAHSMGGLATRQAASEAVAGVPVGSRIGLVITVGTPNTGSWLSSVGLRGPQSGVESAAQTLLFNVLAAKCQDLDTGELIDGVCRLIEAGGSDAAKAMRFGSPQLKQLSSLPSDTPVLALAGDIRLGTHIWNKPLFLPGRAGDMVVDKDSAQANAFSVSGFGGTKTEECDYFVGTDLGPCFHNALIQNGVLRVEIGRAIRLWSEREGQIASASLCPSESKCGGEREVDLDGDGLLDRVAIYGVLQDPGGVLADVFVKARLAYGHTSEYEAGSGAVDALGMLGAGDMNGDGEGEVAYLSDGGAHSRFGQILSWSTKEGRLVPVRLASDSDPFQLYLDGSITSNAGVSCSDQTGDGVNDFTTYYYNVGKMASDGMTAEYYVAMTVVYAWNGEELVKVSQRSRRLPPGEGDYLEPPDEVSETIGFRCPGFQQWPWGDQ